MIDAINNMTWQGWIIAGAVFVVFVLWMELKGWSDV